MSSWQVQEAKQQLSRVIDLARREGPQVVTRNGKEVAIVLAIEEYRRLRSDGGAFKRLLEEAPDFDALEIERPGENARAVEL
jgi:antitoxin Phd